jgi:hypothetical protein
LKIWLALVAAPMLALTDQAVSFAAVGWACAHQQTMAIHAVHAFFLAAVVAGTVPALKLWRDEAMRMNGRINGGESSARRHFLAGVAACVGALSAVVIAAMWMPTWAIAVCSS